MQPPDLPVRIRRISDWAPGPARWIDVDVLEPEPPDEVTPAVLELLQPHCRGELDEAMVSDLLDVRGRREGERYTEGRIRSLSAFRASTRTLDGGGEVTFQPVEMLAGEEWVITCWHTRRIYREARPYSENEPPEPRDDLHDAVTERWSVDSGRTAGDLATMILYELGLTHRQACFAIRGWLEQWELRLYLHNEIDQEGLERLWGLMAQLREWVQPLNRPGITEDSTKSWFSGVSDHRLAAKVDDHCVDRALSEIRHLADTMRDTFQVLSARLLEEQRDRRELLQRRIEIAAAAFLVPTLVVGFYGANTRVPGQGTWAGFWGMVVVLIVLSTLSVAAVWWWQQRRGMRE
jgi:hypothetical protein